MDDDELSTEELRLESDEFPRMGLITIHRVDMGVLRVTATDTFVRGRTAQERERFFIGLARAASTDVWVLSSQTSLWGGDYVAWLRLAA